MVWRHRLVHALRSRPRLARRLAGTLLVILIVGMIALSPLALVALNNKRVDWERLSAIGQSYGAVSAILSAVAVGGVIITLVLQSEQSKDARRFAIREMHRELLRMAIEKPLLLKAWGEFPARTEADPALIVYTNMVLNYFVLLHQAGAASLEEIRAHISFLANGDWTQRYWAETVDVWRTAFPGREREIIEAIDDEFRRARESLSADSVGG